MNSVGVALESLDVWSTAMFSEPGSSMPRVQLCSRIYLEYTKYTTMLEKPIAVLEP